MARRTRHYDPVKDIAEAAIRVAYRQLRRREFTGEAERMRLLDATKDTARSLMRRFVETHDIEAYPLRQIVGQLAGVVRLTHLQAEYNSRTQRRA